MTRDLDERWMNEALDLARQAMERDEVPIGCVIVHDPTQEIIGRGFNHRETDCDPSAHAEIVAMREAGKGLGHWRLVDCTLFVTLEPCTMCAGAMVNARVKRVVYGCDDPKAGAVKSLYTICEDARLNHRLEVTAGVMSSDCASILQEFFKRQRARGKK